MAASESAVASALKSDLYPCDSIGKVVCTDGDGLSALSWQVMVEA